MKGLDTPVLLGLLDGSPSVRSLLRSTLGEELATTELNMLELTTLALQGGSRGRQERLQALERLRRRLTVLPIDRRTVELLAERAPPARSGAEMQLNVMLAAFEAAGCGELLTERRSLTAKGPWKLKLRSVAIK